MLAPAWQRLWDTPVETYACVEVADDLAKAAYRQAANLATIESPIIGVGCTCALATDREKKGVHKVRMSQHGLALPSLAAIWEGQSPAPPVSCYRAGVSCSSRNLLLVAPLLVHAPGIAAAASWRLWC